MWRSTLAVIAVAMCATVTACSNSTTGNSGAPSADPFVGFFAHPGFGMLQIERADREGTYRGSLWADFGPFPVTLTRDGNVARGTVAYGGATHPLQVENTPQGLVLTADGTRADAPLRRYKDRQAYEKWLAAHGGGYRATIEITTQPSR